MKFTFFFALFLGIFVLISCKNQTSDPCDCNDVEQLDNGNWVDNNG